MGQQTGRPEFVTATFTARPGFDRATRDRIVHTIAQLVEAIVVATAQGFAGAKYEDQEGNLVPYGEPVQLCAFDFEAVIERCCSWLVSHQQTPPSPPAKRCRRRTHCASCGCRRTG